MKILFSTILFIFSFTTLFASIDPKVKELINEKNFFALEEKLKDTRLDKESKDYAQALVYNAFGEYQKSIAVIESWKNSHKTDGKDSVYKDLLTVNIDNYYKLSKYKSAALTTQQVIDGFPEITDAEEIKDLKNSGQIWGGLGDTPPQGVILNKTTTLHFTRDIAKLINIEVNHPGGMTKSVFDTGANISVASESTANSMKLRIVADNISVRAITGNEVMAKIGVADEISIGDITVKNAYFLIFADADLSFGNGVYKIDLIVGFPIIMGMGEIAVDLKANTMTIVKDPAPRKVKNLYVDGLTPIVQVKIDKQPLLFSFDSGADKTMFYQRFYNLVKDDKNYDLSAGTSNLGGAGGAKTIDIMIAKHIDLEVGKEKVGLNKIDVLPTNLMNKKEYLFGNLGQDVLNSRKNYVLNLKGMYLELHD